MYDPLLEISLSYFILSTSRSGLPSFPSLYSRFLYPCISRYFCAVKPYFLIPLQGFNARLLSLSIDRILMRKKGMACATVENYLRPTSIGDSACQSLLHAPCTFSCRFFVSSCLAGSKGIQDFRQTKRRFSLRRVRNVRFCVRFFLASTFYYPTS